LPHGVASERVIEKNEFVTIDFGCFYDGYASDITRTFQTGRLVGKNLKRVYQIVFDAQRKATEAARAGVEAKKLDGVARNYIDGKGLGKYFRHGLGHGIGLRIHELPRISRISDDVLEEGNVITIEPGIYVPRLGGVRIEDDFLVTKNGVEQLSHFSKDRDYYISAYGNR
jgi:Xaa-Pro aminopeptidase